jgi:hypothetical protein
MTSGTTRLPAAPGHKTRNNAAKPRFRGVHSPPMSSLILSRPASSAALVLAALCLSTNAGAAQAAPQRPTLVVMLTIDQLRPDYLTMYRSNSRAGWRGCFAVVRCSQRVPDHANTETAPGHASTLSGRFPSSTGIVSNSPVSTTRVPVDRARCAPPYRFGRRPWSTGCATQTPHHEHYRSPKGSRRDSSTRPRHDGVLVRDERDVHNQPYYADSLPAGCRPSTSAGCRINGREDVGSLLDRPSIRSRTRLRWKAAVRITPSAFPSDAAHRGQLSGFPMMDQPALFRARRAEADATRRRPCTDFWRCPLDHRCHRSRFGPDSARFMTTSSD